MSEREGGEPMSGREPREQLLDISRGLRQWLEREQAAGADEALMHSLAGARRGATRVAAAPAASAAPPRSPNQAPAPAASAPPPRAPASARPVVAAPLDSWEPIGAAGPPAPSAPSSGSGAAPVPERRATAGVVAEPPPDVNLFGEAVPKRPAGTGVEVMDDPVMPLPPVHPPLHPIGEARLAILEASLPVLEQVAGEARGCEKCGLCQTRTNAVPGVGSAASGIVFVGEAPGADEDAQGEPFVGRAGQLLTQMIQAMDQKRLIPGVPLDRSTVYICNVLKCRPPENRNPLPHEVEQCSPYLHRQLEALRPRVICCLGKFAAELLVGVKGASLGAMRGKTYRYRGAKLIVTYHPAALLRNPNWKRPAWDDLQRLAQEYLTD